MTSWVQRQPQQIKSQTPQLPSGWTQDAAPKLTARPIAQSSTMHKPQPVPQPAAADNLSRHKVAKKTGMAGVAEAQPSERSKQATPHVQKNARHADQAQAPGLQTVQQAAERPAKQPTGQKQPIQQLPARQQLPALVPVQQEAARAGPSKQQTAKQQPAQPHNSSSRAAELRRACQVCFWDVLCLFLCYTVGTCHLMSAGHRMLISLSCAWCAPHNGSAGCHAVRTFAELLKNIIYKACNSAIHRRTSTRGGRSTWLAANLKMPGLGSGTMCAHC